MIHDLAEERKPVSGQTPYLSYSRINRYLHCPEQYRLYYIENLRPKFPSASLVFGQVLHQSFAYFFNQLGNPVDLFLQIWEEIKQYDLSYNQKESWEKLRDVGQA